MAHSRSTSMEDVRSRDMPTATKVYAQAHHRTSPASEKPSCAEPDSPRDAVVFTRSPEQQRQLRVM